MFGFLSSPCSLFASAPLLLSSIPCSPLPGALDRWALGAVFYCMAHTVCGITAAIFSFGTLLSRRAWDPRDTLLANGTRGSHLTIAWGAWNTRCSRRAYISHLSNTLVSFFSRRSSWSWESLSSWPALSANLSWKTGGTWGSRTTWSSIFSWRPRPTRGRHHLYWHLHARHVIAHSLIKDLNDLLANEVLDFVVIDNSVISWRSWLTRGAGGTC